MNGMISFRHCVRLQEIHNQFLKVITKQNTEPESMRAVSQSFSCFVNQFATDHCRGIVLVTLANVIGVQWLVDSQHPMFHI